MNVGDNLSMHQTPWLSCIQPGFPFYELLPTVTLVLMIITLYSSHHDYCLWCEQYWSRGRYDDSLGQGTKLGTAMARTSMCIITEHDVTREVEGGVRHEAGRVECITNSVARP